MGGSDSQKLRPWRGIYSSPGRSKPPAHSKLNTVPKNCGGISRSAVSPAIRVVAQLLAAWVIFGKQTWVTSRERRRIAEYRETGVALTDPEVPSRVDSEPSESHHSC